MLCPDRFAVHINLLLDRIGSQSDDGADSTLDYNDVAWGGTLQGHKSYPNVAKDLKRLILRVRHQILSMWNDERGAYVSN